MRAGIVAVWLLAVLGAGAQPAVAASLSIEGTDGAAGSTVTIEGWLRGGGGDVVAIQEDVTFDPRFPVDVLSDGEPDCSFSAIARKQNSSFTLQPVGCVPGANCTKLLVLVVSLNPDTAFVPIPDGLLFTCRFTIPAEASSGNAFAFSVANVLLTDRNLDEHAGAEAGGQVTVTGSARAGGLAPRGSAGLPAAGAPPVAEAGSATGGQAAPAGGQPAAPAGQSAKAPVAAPGLAGEQRGQPTAAGPGGVPVAGAGGRPGTEVASAPGAASGAAAPTPARPAGSTPEPAVEANPTAEPGMPLGPILATVSAALGPSPSPQRSEPTRSSAAVTPPRAAERAAAAAPASKSGCQCHVAGSPGRESLPVGATLVPVALLGLRALARRRHRD